MKFFAFCFFAILIHPICAQSIAEELYDTAKRIDPVSVSQDGFLRNSKYDQRLDSSLLYFQQYDRTKKNNIAIQNLGDVHTPFLDLQFRPYEKTGVVAGMNPFQNLYYSIEQARFYNTPLPYTEFQYAQGKGGRRGMIDFDAMHTQNFGKKFNFAALYHSSSNDGYYSRQSLSCKNLLLSSYYKSESQRYAATFIFTWNKTNFLENGGIVQTENNEALFKRLPNNSRIVPVSLNNARNINRYREMKFSHVYWIIMGTDSDTGKSSTGKLGISHSFSALKNSNYYTDKSSDFGFYDSVYLYNDLASTDSFALTQVSNSIEVFTPLNGHSLAFKAGLKNDHFSVYQSANPSNYNNYIAHNNSVYAQFNFKLSKRFVSEATGTYYYEGYNQNDYLLKWKNSSTWGKHNQWSIRANALSNARKADFRQLRVLSNHFRWDNSFKQTRNQNISVGISKNIKRPSIYNAYSYALPKKAFEIEANYTLIDNFIYYGVDNTPKQGGVGQSCFQAVAKVHANLKAFQVHQELLYQVLSNELKTQMQLPSICSKTSLYYQTYAFKKATFLQIGLDANITSAYKASFYNPGIVNFRVSDKSVGAYPFIDFFINAEVKTARIFLKIEHVNQNFQNINTYQNYMFTSPYQASAPFRLRLGFAWKFYY